MVGADPLAVGDDLGATLSFEVTPVAQSGASTGTVVTSSGVGPVMVANTAPVASGVTIDRKSVV